MSRRYLRVLLRWIPYGRSVFNEWPVRPRCGHFIGGVLWYCQDAAMPAFALAAAASSPEYDEQQARSSRDQVRETTFQALRYACLTHDTGPEDCVGPRASWGRNEPAGTKWGERGRGGGSVSSGGCFERVPNRRTCTTTPPARVAEPCET